MITEFFILVASSSKADSKTPKKMKLTPKKSPRKRFQDPAVVLLEAKSEATKQEMQMKIELQKEDIANQREEREFKRQIELRKLEVEEQRLRNDEKRLDIESEEKKKRLQIEEKKLEMDDEDRRAMRKFILTLAEKK